MKAFKVKKDSVKKFEAEPNYFIENYLTKDAGLGFSMVVSHIDGNHPLMKNTLSDRVYYFLSGKGKFYIDDEIFEVGAGDMLVVPKNTLYKFEGKFDSVLISCPAFDKNSDIIFKN